MLGKLALFHFPNQISSIAAYMYLLYLGKQTKRYNYNIHDTIYNKKYFTCECE